MPLSIAALPHAVVAHALRFLIASDNDNETDATAFVRLAIPTELIPLAVVSREWYTLAVETHATQRLESLHVVSWAKRREDVVEVRRQLTLRRGRLRRLAIFDLSTSDGGLWAAAFSLVPKITTLLAYSTDVGYTNAQRAEIVRAAGVYCPQIDQLELPPFKSNRRGYPPYRWPLRIEDEDEDEVSDCPALEKPAQHSTDADVLSTVVEPHRQADPIAELVDAVFESAQLWRRHGRAGLRRLCFSAHALPAGLSSASNYVSRLAQYCPEVQVLTGWEEMHRRGSNGEKWTIDLTTWDRFARSCSQLTEFNWLPVPYATRFFEIFGRHTKSKLAKLTIATCERWDWSAHLNELNPSERSELIESGYGSRARNVAAMLRGCPNLSILTVQCFFPVGVETLMEPNEFGDEFCEALATCCPKLVSFSIIPRYGYWTRPGSITTFTDRSMIALARLSLLRYVNITGANITGDGLYTLVIDHANASTAVRAYEIRIGNIYDGPAIVDSLIFYRILQRFLERLANEPRDLTNGSRRVTLKLINEGNARLDEVWLTSYLQTNEQLREKVLQRHPYVGIEQTTKGAVMWGIREFVFLLNV